MPGIFEALANRPKKTIKKHFININGKKVEVDLPTKIKVSAAGEQNFEINEGKIARKKRSVHTMSFTVLKKADKGFAFHDNNPFWPDKIIKGGYAWQEE